MGHGDASNGMAPDADAPFSESITLETGLLHLGETVTIRLTSRQDYAPLTLEVTPQYLEQEFNVGEGVRVDWDASGDIKQGTAVFTPERPGSYLVRFGELHRSFAVVDDSYAICTLLIPFASSRYPCGNQLDHYHPDLHQKHIPADYEVMITDARSLDPDWDLHKTLRAFRWLFGDGVIPYIDGLSLPALDVRWQGKTDLSLRNISGQDAPVALQALQVRWQALGFGKPGIIHMDTPGDAIIEAASALGIEGIGMGETHRTAAHNRPAYIHKTVIGYLRQSMRTSAGEAEAMPLNPGFFQASGRASPEDMSRFTAAVDEYTVTGGTAGPAVFSLVFDGDDAGVVSMNRHAIACLIERPRRHNMVFARKGDVVHYFRRCIL